MRGESSKEQEGAGEVNEQRDSNEVRRWQVFAISLILLTLWFTDSVKQGGKIRDLQRRVATLEQQVRR